VCCAWLCIARDDHITSAAAQPRSLRLITTTTTTMERDPYEVLNLPVDATTEQIQQRFEEAVLSRHPSDLTVIHAVRMLLMDEGRRCEWDRQRPAVNETLHGEEEEERRRLREEEMLAERQVEFNRDRSRRQRQRRPSPPPPYGSTDYGTCSASPPYSPPTVRRQKAPRNRDERTPLFPSRPQGILLGFRRRAAACSSTVAAAAFHFMVTVLAPVLQLFAVAFISASAFAIPVFALFGIIWLIAIGLMGLANALGRVHWPQLPPPYQRNIAIVGAGPAGVTTAYQLSQLCSQQGIPVQITIYEQSSHIGGRAVHSIVLPTGDSLELSAGTFPKTARLLTSAAYNLGLEIQMFSNNATDLTGPSGTGSFGVFVPHDVRAIEQLTNTFYLATTAAPGPSLNQSRTTSSTTIVAYYSAGGGHPHVASAASSRMLGNDFPTCTIPSPT